MLNKTQQTLIKAKEILQTQGWGKKAFHKKDGSYCMIGALAAAAGSPSGQPYRVPGSTVRLYYDAEGAVSRVLRRMGHEGVIPGFNDRASTTKDDVLAVFDKAIEEAGK